MKRIKTGIIAGLIIAVISYVGCLLIKQVNHPSNFQEIIKGEFTRSLLILVLLMAIDFLLGIVNAIFFKKSKKSTSGGLSSGEGTKGVIKKVSVIVLIVVLHLFINLQGLKNDFGIVVHSSAYIFAGMEFVSILENLYLMGVPIPRAILSLLDVVNKGKKTLTLKEIKGEEGEKEEKDKKIDLEKKEEKDLEKDGNKNSNKRVKNLYDYRGRDEK